MLRPIQHDLTDPWRERAGQILVLHPIRHSLQAILGVVDLQGRKRILPFGASLANKVQHLTAAVSAQQGSPHEWKGGETVETKLQLLQYLL